MPYTMRFYHVLDPFGQIQYRPPAFSGFWSKQLPDQQTYMIQASGRTYRVTELQQVLFATVEGQPLAGIGGQQAVVPTNTSNPM